MLPFSPSLLRRAVAYGSLSLLSVLFAFAPATPPESEGYYFLLYPKVKSVGMTPVFASRCPFSDLRRQVQATPRPAGAADIQMHGPFPTREMAEKAREHVQVHLISKHLLLETAQPFNSPCR